MADEDKGLATQTGEAWQLVIAYAKQETIEPIKGLGRYVAAGMAGSIFLSAAGVLGILALLRALQTETGTTFEGNWSWVPYLITLVVAGLLAALAAGRINKRRSAR